jgi:hypothetical protein
VKTGRGLNTILNDVEHDHLIDLPRQESFIHHPIHTIAHEAAHLREIADKGDSTATPAILVAAVVAFVVPIAALLILLDFGVAHFS